MEVTATPGSMRFLITFPRREQVNVGKVYNNTSVIYPTIGPSHFIPASHFHHHGNHFCLITRLEDLIRRSAVFEINTSFEMRHFGCLEGRLFLVKSIELESARWFLFAGGRGDPGAVFKGDLIVTTQRKHINASLLKKSVNKLL